MTFGIIVRRAAAQDIREAHAWYEAQSSGLGREFLDEVEAALQRIANGPDCYKYILGDARRALVRRFPYSVYFRVRGEDVRIVGVIHQHRDPRIWRRRV